MRTRAKWKIAAKAAAFVARVPLAELFILLYFRREYNIRFIKKKELIMKQETIEQVLKFRDDRNWRQFHNPKDLAISICLEAAEPLEIFQWSAEDVQCEDKKDKIREELADVLNYCVLMADVCGLDMDEIVLEKIKRNEEKYPVEKAYGSKEKYTELKRE